MSICNVRRRGGACPRKFYASQILNMVFRFLHLKSVILELLDSNDTAELVRMFSAESYLYLNLSFVFFHGEIELSRKGTVHEFTNGSAMAS